MVNNGYYATNRMKFGPRVQERALGIFNRGGVELLSFNGKRAVAKVQGTKTYRVEFTFYPDHRVNDHHCTCPFHDNYNGFCKHEIATLLAIDEEGASLLRRGNKGVALAGTNDERARANEFLLALSQAKALGEKERLAQSKSLLDEAKEKLDRSGMFELCLRFCVPEMKASEENPGQPIHHLLVHEAMSLMPIPEQKSILRELYAGRSPQGKEAAFRLLSSFPFPEDLYDFLAALFDTRDLALLEKLNVDAYFGLFRDETLAKLVRYTPLSSMPPMRHLIRYIEEKGRWRTFGAMLLSDAHRLGEENSALLRALFSRLPKDENLFSFLYDSIYRRPYENDLLKYFRSFPAESRLNLFAKHRQFLDDDDPKAYQLCAGVYCPERLSDFYHFSPAVLAICKADLLEAAPEQTATAIPKYIDRHMKRLARQRRIDEADLEDTLSFIEAYAEVPEVVQALRDPLLDQWTFHYGGQARIRYLLLLQDMPSFIGMRRF